MLNYVPNTIFNVNLQKISHLIGKSRDRTQESIFCIYAEFENKSQDAMGGWSPPTHPLNHLATPVLKSTTACPR